MNGWPSGRKDTAVPAATNLGRIASVFTSCHGVWTHLQERTFASTSFGLISDLGGSLVGYLEVRGIYTVSQSGNDYTGASVAQILDVGGNVVFSVGVTNAGTRIVVELP